MKRLQIERLDASRVDPVGLVLTIRDQKFYCISAKPYINGRGEQTAILTWESICATCGLPFQVTSGATLRGFARLRCDEHKHKQIFTRSEA